MKKRIIIAMSMICSGTAITAQTTEAVSPTGIIATRPANDASGKILTMEETILSRTLSPARHKYVWPDDGTTGELWRIDGNGCIRIVDIRKDGPEQETGKKYMTAERQIPKKEKGWKNILASPKRADESRLYSFTEKNNLYILNPDGGIDTLTNCKNSDIVAGQTVSRNEFGIDGGMFWSPDGRRLAYYVKDESKVTSFPLLDITTRTGSLRNIKYPMAGMDSERVGLYIYDTVSRQTYCTDTQICIDAGLQRPEETYITNVCWSPDGRHIFTQLLDRSQKHQMLCMFDACGRYVRTILTEDNEKYVEPLDPIRFIKGQNDIFIYRTANRDGYRNLYLCDTKGSIRRLTATDADVAYIANDGKYVYYTSAEVSPVENHLFRIGMKNLKKGVKGMTTGRPERLTTAEGWHSINMSPDCSHYIDSYSSLCVPGITDLCKADGTRIRNLLTSPDPTLGHAYSEISLGTVRSADGRYDNYYRLIKPKDFDPSKKYPVIIYVYGGPHSQMVTNSFTASLRRWEMYMAQRGYLVYVQDNRGTSNRGIEFEQAIYGQCGQAEMADQMEGVKMLLKLPYVDKERIGVHGWSYGGFMTISLMTNFPEVFKVGVAGGPVIDWKWYEVMYGERYMGHPDTNPDGYAKTSLINKAKDLKGRLLICQGAVDPVVVWEHSLSFVRECIKENVQVDYFPYPCAEHNVYGKDRVHLHDKITRYFEDYL